MLVKQSMKIYFSILCLFCLQSTVLGQNGYLIKIDQLNTRLENGKDTIYIINFWATWCVPCVKEIPNFEKLNEQYKSEKLKILLICVDFKSQLNTSVIPFIKKRNLRNEVFLLDEKDQQEYINRIDTSWSGSIPATLFVKKSTRKFIEKEFTYPELIKVYKTMQ